jgi:hypothetical protein
MMRNAVWRVLLAGSVCVAVVGWGLGAAVASASPVSFGHSVFVSTTGGAGATGRSCATAGFSSIQAAIEATPLHGTVIVCPGTYDQSATVDRDVNLVGVGNPVIDATGQVYGIGVATSWVTVRGFTVENASNPMLGDGIITAGFVNGAPVVANHVTITDDAALNNLGNGIDLNSTSYSAATHDYAAGNGVGVNISDDLGVLASHNLIANDVAVDNPGGCGIDLAEHSGVGIFDNAVVNNISNDNGLGSPTAPDASSGSGVILADGAMVPTGGVYNNLVAGNVFKGNGHPGVVLVAGEPGDMNGNVVTGNQIGTNNSHNDAADLHTTGVLVADLSPVTIHVTGNVISDDYYGIFTIGAATVVRGVHGNVFRHVTQITGYSPTF